MRSARSCLNCSAVMTTLSSVSFFAFFSFLCFFSLLCFRLCVFSSSESSDDEELVCDGVGDPLFDSECRLCFLSFLSRFPDFERDGDRDGERELRLELLRDLPEYALSPWVYLLDATERGPCESR